MAVGSSAGGLKFCIFTFIYVCICICIQLLGWWSDTQESKSVSTAGSQTDISQLEIPKCHENSKIYLPSHKNNFTWSVDPLVPPVSQELLVSDLPSDVLPSETFENLVLK